jgi:VCBS repeat-containing protein
MKVRRRAIALATAAVLGTAGVVAVTSAGAHQDEVRLHLGTDGKYFKYGSTKQVLTTSPWSCKINSAEPLINLEANGATGAAPGIGSKPSIGVYSSGYSSGSVVTSQATTSGHTSSGNGTPCSKVDGPERLVLTPGTNLAGRRFSGLRLDLELTGDATAQLKLSRGTQYEIYLLQTGRSITSAQSSESDYDRTAPYNVSSKPGDTTDACAAPNSSGPNSGSNDNCEWTVQAGFEFDTITLSVVSKGSVSLEGSGDFGNNPAYDSVFYLSNRAPTANADTVTTNEDTAVSGNVLANDSDPDGNPLTATKLTNPAHGTLTFAGTGAFTYTPSADYFGPDSFTYSASDGKASASATVSVTVKPVNDRPVARSGTVATDEDETVTITAATDVDSTSLTTTCTGAGGGTVTDNGDGTIDFRPATDLNGTVTLSCATTDDQGASTTSSATITVGVSAVNDPPHAEDDAAEVNESASVAIPVLDNDSDVDGDPLAPTAIADVTPLGSSAVANLDGTVTYTPPTGFTGEGSFTYRATDGELTSNVATVSVEVIPVICTNETVTDSDGEVDGAFTRLDDEFSCKRYSLTADETEGTVRFSPEGATNVEYRGFLSFGAVAPPDPPGPVSLLLEYDPTGGNSFQPVTWCIDPQFDEGGQVTSATLAPGETWCIAGSNTTPNGDGDLVTVWQVYGRDDPKFR